MPLPAAWSTLAGADIYLLDLVLRGIIAADATVLDIGCGSGRNLAFLAQAGASITAVDADPAVVAACSQRLAQGPGSHSCSCRVASLPQLGLDGCFDAVICIAVLHFAPDQASFHVWADACWHRLKPGGVFLARLSTRIALPDVSAHFAYRPTLADLEACEQRWQATRIDPLKTTLVEEKRVMSTWTLHRPG